MIYLWMADAVLVFHFGFVLFVIFGGLLTVSRRWVLWLHLPALAWGAAVEFFALHCPLTALEKYLTALSGAEVYEGDFIAHLINSVLYPQITVQILTMLGFLLVGFNLFVYLFVFYRAGFTLKTF